MWMPVPAPRLEEEDEQALRGRWGGTSTWSALEHPQGVFGRQTPAGGRAPTIGVGSHPAAQQLRDGSRDSLVAPGRLFPLGSLRLCDLALSTNLTRCLAASLRGGSKISGDAAPLSQGGGVESAGPGQKGGGTGPGEDCLLSPQRGLEF